MKNLQSFTNLYPVTKTLRFDLIPVGKTLEHIDNNDIIAKDTELADSYKKMKKTIDEYHKHFIDECMKDVKLSHLEEFYALYTANAVEKSDDNYKQKFDSVRKALRKEIAAVFSDKKHKEVKESLDKKELIQKILKPWIEDNKLDLYYDEAFCNFTTLFTGYNENRMNMYSDEEKATSIAYRLINENLPRFIDNLKVFNEIKDKPVAQCFRQIKTEFGCSPEEMFSLDSFHKALTQGGIAAYNTIIGGYTEEGSKHTGLNKYINRYNQKNPKAKLPKFKPLFKQILSDRVIVSWLPEAFDTADDMFDAVSSFYDNAMDNKLFKSITEAASEAKNANPQKLYIRNDSLSAISSALFGYYGLIRDSLEYYYIHTESPDYTKKLASAKNDAAIEKLEKEKNAFVKGKKYHSVALIEAALEGYLKTIDLDSNPEFQGGLHKGCVISYFAEEGETLLNRIAEAAAEAEAILKTNHDESYRLTQKDKDSVKVLLDTELALLHYFKPLYVTPDESLEKDDLFYGVFDPIYEELKNVTRLYDMVRNFCTKKPFSTEKINLTFNTHKGNLLNGWVDSKTDNSDNGTQYGGYIFRKINCLNEYDYYLGISRNAKLFRYFNEVDITDKSGYERLDYYQPKEQTIYGSAYKGKKSYAEDKTELLKIISDYVKETKNAELIKDVTSYCENRQATPTGCLGIISKNYPQVYEKLIAGASFSEKNDEVISNLKSTLNSMARLVGTDSILQKQYGLFTEIMSDISVLCKTKIFNYFAVSQKELEQAEADPDKPLYLFKINNKDLSFADSFAQGKRTKRGRDNLHTMYFKALLSGTQNTYDIGSASVFFRRKSIEGTVTHPKGTPVALKNPDSVGKSNTFDYDLIKDRRYSYDKFLLHISMTANYSAEKQKKNVLNESVCSYLKNNPDVNIIGIDRGERHLLYISMVDRNGNVVKDEEGKYIQYSLNTITGSFKDAEGNNVTFSTPYHTLLDNKETERQKAREDWGTIENIKELKEGYLSQVVHHISRLMVKYNAIVVLEDLNGGFKNSRKKVEKQVYQNFEKALIQKLNYLVFKECDAESLGGLYNAYQLTDEFESFDRLSKQTGFLFYVPAWNTSKIDPVTGFTDLLKPKYKSIPEAQNFFGRFDSISYCADKQYFEFSFDYDNFTEKASGTRTKWTVCTHENLRYSFNRSLNNNRGGYEKIDVTTELMAHFAEFGISYEHGNLVPDIINQKSVTFFKRLIKLLQITLAMRYSCAEDGADFILSPVMDKDGKFFSSEYARVEGLPLPHDADANGAYNIARKGIMVLQSIDKAEKYKDWTTKISNKDWLRFVQEN